MVRARGARFGIADPKLTRPTTPLLFALTPVQPTRIRPIHLDDRSRRADRASKGPAQLARLTDRPRHSIAIGPEQGRGERKNHRIDRGQERIFIWRR